MSVADIFKFIGVSFIPVVISVLLYIGFKHLYKKLEKKDPNTLPKLLRTDKSRYWVRQVVVGLVLGGFSIGCYFIGVDVKDYITVSDTLRVGISTFFPVIAGLVFGWPSAVISTIIAFVFRLSIPSNLTLPTVIACVLGGIASSLTSHVLLKDQRSKWYYAFFGGFFVETINIFLLFLFHLNHLSDAYRTIRQFDMVCILCHAFSAALTCVILQIYEKEPVFVNLKKDRRISGRIQLSLFIISVLGLLITTGATFVVTYSDAYDFARSNMFNNAFDMHKDFTTMKSSESAQKCVERHFVSDRGFVITVAVNDNTKIYNDAGEEIGTYNKNQMVGIPAIAQKRFETHPGRPFYFDGKKTIDQFLNNISTVKDTYGDSNFVLFENNIYSNNFLCCFTKETNKHTSDEFYSIVLVPYDEVLVSCGIPYRVVLYSEFIVFVLLFAFVNLLVSKRIIENIETMDKSLEKIMEGNLNEELSLKGGYKEFEQLSNNINLTVGALKNYGEEIERRVASELEFAKEIQDNSLPRVFPNEETYNIFALMNTAKEVGGDFYDCFKMNNGRIMILIADVSGKGIPAAMFMMRARTLIKSLTLQDASVAEIATETNNMLIENNEAGIFVTAWLGILDPATGELNYVNAGHCEPLLKSNDKYDIFHNNHQLVLAGMKDYKYTSETVYLKPGEELLLYTDGVTEATDKDYKQYGTDRLISFVNNAKYFNAKQLLTEISDDVARFEGYSDQFDDITMLCLRYIGVSTNRPENVLTLKAFPRNASVAINYVESILTREGLNIDPFYIPQMSIVVDELFANVAYHAYPKGVVGELTIEVDIKDDILYLTFIDSGIPFDPTLPFKADTTSKIEDRKQGGLGIFLVKKAVDKLTYERKNNSNHLYIEKNLKAKVNKEEK